MDVEDGLTVERRNAGYVLPCVSRAEGTVVLSVLRSKIPALKKRQPSGRLYEDESTDPPERHVRRNRNKSDLRQLSTCRGKNREIQNSALFRWNCETYIWRGHAFRIDFCLVSRLAGPDANAS